MAGMMHAVLRHVEFACDQSGAQIKMLLHLFDTNFFQFDAKRVIFMYNSKYRYSFKNIV